jgi:NitT/TauT family transport system substrate-binding protein
MKHRRSKNLFVTLAIAAVASAALLAGAGSSAPVAKTAQKTTDVTVRMDFFLNEAHAGFFAALAKGYYADEGLNVDIRPGQGSVSTVQQVAAGNDNFGLASAVAMTQQVAKGASVVAIASPRQVFDGGILYWPSSGINNPKDLEGKTVAITAAGFVALLMPTWAQKVGVDLKKVNTRVLDAAAGNALFGAQKVDGLEGTRAQQLFYSPVNGVTPKIFRFSDAGLNALGQAIIAQPAWAKAHPGIATKFLRATLKGWNWACDNPRAAVDNVRTKITTTNTPARSLATWKLICSFARTPNAKGKPLGWMSLKDWGTTVTMLRASPLLGIQNAVPGAASLYTNFYVNASNKK